MGGGTTAGFNQIAVPGLLSSTVVALASNLVPFPQRDRSNTISTHWEEPSDDRPGFGNRKHANTTRNMRRARAHTAGLVGTGNLKFYILWFINSIRQIAEFAENDQIQNGAANLYPNWPQNRAQTLTLYTCEHERKISQKSAHNRNRPRTFSILELLQRWLWRWLLILGKKQFSKKKNLFPSFLNHLTGRPRLDHSGTTKQQELPLPGLDHPETSGGLAPPTCTSGADHAAGAAAFRTGITREEWRKTPQTGSSGAEQEGAATPFSTGSSGEKWPDALGRIVRGRTSRRSPPPPPQTGPEAAPGTTPWRSSESGQRMRPRSAA